MSMTPPPVQRPADLPDARLWMLDMWRDGHLWDRVEKLTMAGMRSKGWAEEFVSISRRFDTEVLPGARLYYVTADMTRVIANASKTLLPTTLTPEIMPCPEGLIFFEEPLIGMPASIEPIFDEHDREQMEAPLPVRYLLWGTATIPVNVKCLGIATYCEFDNNLAPSGRTDWRWGFDTDEPTDQQVADLSESERRLASMAEDRRWLATFWLLLQQRRVAEELLVRPQRAAARRSARADVSAEVRVINVHQPKHSQEPGEERKVDWSHRWIVEGFWRQQAYGPGHSLRRPQYIASFIKGPTDKPLIVKETVRVLRGEGLR